ncbi:MAG: histidine--tRNA ligase [Candidatus Omnitrophota bacterium]
MRIKAVRGTKDILPYDAKIWRLIEDKARSLLELYCYQEIRTPLLEEARLFTRSIGESSDIVRKEMYSFKDRKERVLCLRPEGTASVVRAYLEHDLDQSEQLSKFYYFGPMFRAERPQAGRLRQFHHIGVEAIGSGSPYLDAEVITLAVRILEHTGVNNFTVHLNSIGSQQDREEFKSLISTALKSKIKELCPDCHSRLKTNVLRIFDCKNTSCQAVTRQLPPITQALGSQSKEHFLQVQKLLDTLSIPYTLNPFLVRGLDYYTTTCFEIVHPNLGAQNALGAGGRYDSLVSDLGGPPRPAVGFALGMERLIAAKIVEPGEPGPGMRVFIAVLGDQAQPLAFSLLNSLRGEGISAEMNYQDKSLKSQMRLADKLAAANVVIIGEEEVKKQKVILRNMRDKTQKEVEIARLAQELE